MSPMCGGPIPKVYPVCFKYIGEAELLAFACVVVDHFICTS